MRNPERPELAEITAREGLPIEIRTLDVNSDESVRNCFASVAEPLDVLVNNAGVENHGSIEELPMEAFVATMNTNYLAAVQSLECKVASICFESKHKRGSLSDC